MADEKDLIGELLETTPDDQLTKDQLNRRELQVLHNKKALLEALEKSLGIVTTACKAVGLSRQAYYRYLNDPAFEKAVMDLNEVAKDFVESQLHKQIKNGSTVGAIFYLKHKAKDRGYTGMNAEVNPQKMQPPRINFIKKKAK